MRTNKIVRHLEVLGVLFLHLGEPTTPLIAPGLIVDGALVRYEELVRVLRDDDAGELSFVGGRVTSHQPGYFVLAEHV